MPLRNALLELDIFSNTTKYAFLICCFHCFEWLINDQTQTSVLFCRISAAQSSRLREEFRGGTTDQAGRCFSSTKWPTFVYSSKNLACCFPAFGRVGGL